MAADRGDLVELTLGGTARSEWHEATGDGPREGCGDGSCAHTARVAGRHGRGRGGRRPRVRGRPRRRRAAPAWAGGPTGLEPRCLVAGLTYVVVDGSAFAPRTADSSWPRNIITQGTELTSGGTLVAPIGVPVGAVLKQVLALLPLPFGPTCRPSIMRKLFVGTYDAVAPPAPLAGRPVPAVVHVGHHRAGQRYGDVPMFVNTLDATQLVGGLLVGYIAPASPAFFPLPKITASSTPAPRAASSRPTRSDRHVSASRPGPGRACSTSPSPRPRRPASWPRSRRRPRTRATPASTGSAPNQNLANGVICAVDGTGSITIRGGVNKTHVVIDVQGYLV